MRFANSTIERSNGTQSIVYAWALNNMGSIYHLQGRLTEALEYQQRARVIKEKVLGPDDPDVAGSLGNVALALNAIGRSTEALDICNRAIQIAQRSEGATHPNVASELSNRGEILLSLQRFPEAFKSYEEALVIFRREFGADNPMVAYALSGEGRALIGLGKLDEARPALERSLAIRRQLDPDDHRLAETEFALARTMETGRSASDRAIVLARRALSRCDRLPGTKRQQAEIAAWLVAHGARPNAVASARSSDSD
jgi:tetratricopeptide (TPR) repeat protein